MHIDDRRGAGDRKRENDTDETNEETMHQAHRLMSLETMQELTLFT